MPTQTTSVEGESSDGMSTKPAGSDAEVPCAGAWGSKVLNHVESKARGAVRRLAGSSLKQP